MKNFNLIPILRDPNTIQIPTKIQFIFILKFSDFTFYIFQLSFMYPSQPPTLYELNEHS